MTPRSWFAIRHDLWTLAPGALGLLLVLIACLPLGLPHLSIVAPMLPLMAVYYWSIYRPELMPAPVVFVIGLVQDALTGAPMGAGALVLVLVQGVCVSQRRILVGSSFGVGWLGFAMVAAGAAGLGWLVAALFYLSLVNPIPALVQLGLSVLLYPPVAWVMLRAERLMPRRVAV